MDYIPTTETFIVKGSDRNGMARWRPFTFHDLNVCFNEDTQFEQIAGMFPGHVFFGPFAADSDPYDIREAISILKTVKNIHELLRDADNYLNVPEEKLRDIVSVLENIIKDNKLITLKRGDGYKDDGDATDEISVPECHIYNCEIKLSKPYEEWLRKRLSACTELGSMFRAEPMYYLNLLYCAKIKERNGSAVLAIDVYGHQSLLSDWDEWLKNYEENLPEDTVVSALECIAGLTILSDLLATVHLLSSLPVVVKGKMIRINADDCLTKLWYMCYDASESNDYKIGVCEVCHRLFIGKSKRKRGHSECMNKQRVQKSRAIKYKKLLDDGTNKDEASKLAGISVKKAESLLE